MTDLATELQSLTPAVYRSPLPGFEMVRGYGVASLPFDSGHVLALRVFPQNDFAPYTTIWHRAPGGEWSIFVDGPRLDTACPRYFGAAAARCLPSSIALQWLEPMRLSIQMDAPKLSWTLTIAEPPSFRLMNRLVPRMPERIMRTRGALRFMEWRAGTLFKMGRVTLSAVAPNGQFAILMPRRLFTIVESQAELEGSDLGRPCRSDDNPSIGQIRLPARPIFAEGRNYFQILDMNEYQRLRRELGVGTGGLI